MSFQGYLNTIQAKTGKTAADFRALAGDKGFMHDGILRTDVKAGQIITWLAAEFGLGRGHAMAIVAVLRRPDGEDLL